MKKKVFLFAAEKVLREMNHPLMVNDIVSKALDDGYLATKGRTPNNTMRARISEDIRRLNKKSRFIRVGTNKFGLREWEHKEFSSRMFKKDKSEKVLCITQGLLDNTGRFFGFKFNYEPYLRAIQEDDAIKILDRDKADVNYNFKQLVSYVILKDERGSLLTYRRGSYSSIKENVLQGALCIGFGGHLEENDLYSLFGGKGNSIIQGAYREISEELKGIVPNSLRIIGVLNDDSSLLGLRHFAFVLEAFLPLDIDINKHASEMSINKLKLMSEKELLDNFYELEFWSQLIIKKIYGHKDHSIPVVIRDKRKLLNIRNTPILIVGEIGSGKTEVAKFLAKSFDLHYISTRKCTQELINQIDFEKNSRIEFQEKALQLINSEDGPNQLANKIDEKIKQYGSNRVIIDGMRNISTLDNLKKKHSDLIIVYVEMSRDKAFEIYKRDRSSNITLNEFRNERNHEIEREVTLFKSRADLYVFNGGKLNQLYNEIFLWWSKNVSL